MTSGFGHTHSRKSLNLWPIRLKEGVAGLILIMLRELGMVEGFDIVPDGSSLDGLFGQLAVAKVIPIDKVALIDLLGFVLVRDFEKGLANVILALNLLICETVADDTEEARVVHLLGF